VFKTSNMLKCIKIEDRANSKETVRTDVNKDGRQNADKENCRPQRDTNGCFLVFD